VCLIASALYRFGLAPVIDRYPELRVVFEHITTREAVEFVRGAAWRGRDHHPPDLLMNCNALFTVASAPTTTVCRCSRRSRIAAPPRCRASGDFAFLLGTDSAPHARHTKEAFCAVRGIFSAHAAIELYVEAFDAVARLENSTASRLNTAPRLWLAI